MRRHLAVARLTCFHWHCDGQTSVRYVPICLFGLVHGAVTSNFAAKWIQPPLVIFGGGQQGGKIYLF